MDISELIGYVITALALFYFMGRGQKKDRPREEEREQDDQAQKLKDFLRSLDLDMQEEAKPVSKPKPVPKKKAAPVITHAIHVEDRKLQSSYKDPYVSYKDLYKHYEDPYKHQVVSVDIGNAPSYQVIGKEGVSRAGLLLAQLQSKRDMVLLREILGPPKGL